MPAVYYPAMIDRSADGFGVTFPDFDGLVAHGASIGAACIQAEQALALHLEGMIRDKDDIPAPSDLESIEMVEGADDVARVMVRADIPVKVERVLVSIDANLLRSIDAVAPNRSAFIAEAARARLPHRPGSPPTQAALIMRPPHPDSRYANLGNLMFLVPNDGRFKVGDIVQISAQPEKPEYGPAAADFAIRIVQYRHSVGLKFSPPRDESLPKLDGYHEVTIYAEYCEPEQD
ncbi:Predicted nuclease of the RNAse H fold, HicB family [Sphingomonas gellani]|uniref:Predicted nuclease of the RNAse H fold, HicB family n=1 Tax=Sphingomonas gellani TaxID=1166340 RepID=A0A1H8H5P6_9SPHN|nr:type II toxin-antitoxin system HicB family antitoxin [Sphingomonas gellani]SEN51047.1 Predicted nuclease of the RNAse H fold, HicB family [Sphingomonas gellani]